MIHTPQLTRNNHLKYMYNGVPFTFRQSPDDVFSVCHDPVRRAPQSWREECISTAREIRDSYSGPMEILFSGGMDSEVVVRSFLTAGIDFKVYIMEFKDGLNRHDVSFALKTCAKLGLVPTMIPLDIRRFWEKDVWKYSDAVCVPSPQLAAIFWAVDQLDGIAILGGGDGFFRRHEGSNIFYEWETEIFYSFYRWFVKSNRAGVPAFFQYNSELMLSFMLEPEVLNFVRDGKSRRLLSTKKIKHDFYSRHFDLEYRMPCNGFENLVEEDKALRAQMLDKYKGANAVYKVNHYKYLKSFGLDLGERIEPYFKNFESLL